MRGKSTGVIFKRFIYNKKEYTIIYAGEFWKGVWHITLADSFGGYKHQFVDSPFLTYKHYVSVVNNGERWIIPINSWCKPNQVF